MSHLKLLLLLDFFLNDIEIILHVDFLDGMTVGADEMVMVTVFVEFIALHAVGELHRTQDAFLGEELQLAIHRAEIGFDGVLAEHGMNILCREVLVVLQKNTNDPAPTGGHAMAFFSQMLDDVLLSVHRGRVSSIIVKSTEKGQSSVFDFLGKLPYY